ncbi:MAG TPA: FAD-binding oxidoreductase, partial [Thermoguttaceae bacterium]
PADLEAMHRVRYSFDPYTRFNPGKLLPEKLYCLAPALVPGDRELFFPAQTENKHYPIITQTILPLAKTLAPADQADLSGAVRAAYGEKMAVYPIGGGTRLDYGTHPTKPGVGLSLENLNRLIDYQPDDLTITVQSGMTMAELAKILAQHGQRLPIDVAHPDLATVGGTAAVNPLGLGQFAQGTMRDCLLGFSAVDGQGMIFSGGARVLNNAAGYNMARLMAGSLGTLGILTQLTLSVRPLPEMSAFAACDLPDLNIAERLLMELMHTQPQPTAIELSLGPKRQDNPVLGPMPETSKLRLLVAFEGASEDVHPMLDALRQKCNIYRLTALSTVTGAASKQLWDWLMDFPAQVQITVRPSAVTKMIDALVALDPDCTIQAQAGSGILQAIFSSSKILPVEQGTSKQNNIALNGQEGRENATLHPFAIFLRTQLRPLLQSNPAKLVVLKQPENSNLTTRDVWGPRGDGFVVMQSLKDRFDPAGILNPGRYVFHDI